MEFSMSMVMVWLFSATVLMFLPSAVSLSRLLRRARTLLSGASSIPVRGKVVLVIGASSGIGQEIAKEYSRRGGKVVLVARREGRLRQVQEECRDCGASEVLVFPSDISDERQCQHVIDFTIQQFGRLDILVNNAGTSHSVIFEDCKDLKDSARVMDVDFWGNIYTTLYALEHLQRSNGQIVVTCSVAAYIPYPYLTFYTAAKGAIVNFYDTLRIELFKKNIGITVAFPGFVKTEMTDREPPGHIPRWWPVISAEIVAMAIVEAAVQRRRYVVVPGWYLPSLFYRLFAPEILIWLPQRLILWPAATTQKKK